MFKAALLSVLLAPVVLLAQTPTPTATPEPTLTATPTAVQTATPTPLACAQLQSCLDAAVATAATACRTSNPGCTLKPKTLTDPYVVTASQVADRSIRTTRHAGRICLKQTTRIACNRCYRNAKNPLQLRFDGDLFHGLLARAVTLIEARRVLECAKLP